MESTRTLRTTIQTIRTTKVRRKRRKNARLFAEWTLNVLPTIVLDLDDDDNNGRTTTKKSFGKAFGSLTGGEAEAKAKSAEKLWRILLNALTICRRGEETTTTDNRRDSGENDDDDSDEEESFSFVREKGTAEEKVVSLTSPNATFVSVIVLLASSRMVTVVAGMHRCSQNVRMRFRTCYRRPSTRLHWARARRCAWWLSSGFQRCAKRV